MATFEENGVIVSDDDCEKPQVTTDSKNDHKEEEKNASNNSSAVKAAQLKGSKAQKLKGNRKSGGDRSGDQSTRRQEILEKQKGLVFICNN